MSSGVLSELEEIKRELSSIINELESISSGVRKDFQGIGSEKCASCINNVIGQYRGVQSQLDRISPSKLTEALEKMLSKN